MRLTTILGLAVAVAGCGGGDKSYSAGTYSLTVGDQGYYSYSDSSACRAGGVGELVLDFVDYSYLCDPKTPAQRADNIEHTTLQIILTIGLPPDYAPHYPTKAPNEVGHAN